MVEIRRPNGLQDRLDNYTEKLKQLQDPTKNKPKMNPTLIPIVRREVNL